MVVKYIIREMVRAIKGRIRRAFMARKCVDHKHTFLSVRLASMTTLCWAAAFYDAYAVITAII